MPPQMIASPMKIQGAQMIASPKHQVAIFASQTIPGLAP